MNIVTVEGYIHFGSENHNKKDNMSEIRRKIWRGWSAFDKLDCILKDKKIPNNLISKEYSQCIILLNKYGWKPGTIQKRTSKDWQERKDYINGTLDKIGAFEKELLDKTMNRSWCYYRKSNEFEVVRCTQGKGLEGIILIWRRPASSSGWKNSNLERHCWDILIVWILQYQSFAITAFRIKRFLRFGNYFSEKF